MNVVVVNSVRAAADPSDLSELVHLLERQSFSDEVRLSRCGNDLDLKASNANGRVIADIHDLAPSSRDWIVHALAERVSATERRYRQT